MLLHPRYSSISRTISAHPAKAWSKRNRCGFRMPLDERMPAYSRIRRLEFAELPKTISGKIRGVELRQREQQQHDGEDGSSVEFREDNFSALKK